MLVSWLDFACQLGTWVNAVACPVCMGDSNVSWVQCVAGNMLVTGRFGSWANPQGLVMGWVVETTLLDPSQTMPCLLPSMEMVPWMRLMPWLQVMRKAQWLAIAMGLRCQMRLEQTMLCKHDGCALHKYIPT